MTLTKLERSIDIDVPTPVVYNQWTQFEQFPCFMDGVDEVEQLDDRRLRWRAHVGPRKVEWKAQIVEQRPDTLIAWRSISGAENSGVVMFAPLGTRQTRVHLTVQYAPEGFFELLGDALGAVARRVEGDLERFKDFIEERGSATGGWRGAIRANTVSRDAVSRDVPPTGPQSQPTD